MASITVNLAPTISSGTATVYLQSNWPYGTAISGAPLGSSVTTGSVGTDGSVTFSGLTAGTSYVAYQASPDRYVRFRVNVPSSSLSSSLVTTKGDLLAATGSGAVVRKGVGSDGQVLTADAASAEGVKWAAAGGSVARGRAKFGGTVQLSIPGVTSTGSSTWVSSSNRAQYFPFLVDTAITIDQIVVEITAAAATSAFRIAIYNADTDWQPTTLVAGADTGALAGTATGVIATTISDTVLAAGRYLFWLSESTGNITFRSIRGSVSQLLGLAVGLGNNPGWSQIYTAAAQTYGAPPSTGLAWDSATVAPPGVFDNPVLVRVKTP